MIYWFILKALYFGVVWVCRELRRQARGDRTWPAGWLILLSILGLLTVVGGASVLGDRSMVPVALFWLAMTILVAVYLGRRAARAKRDEVDHSSVGSENLPSPQAPMARPRLPGERTAPSPVPAAPTRLLLGDRAAEGAYVQAASAFRRLLAQRALAGIVKSTDLSPKPTDEA